MLPRALAIVALLTVAAAPAVAVGVPGAEATCQPAVADEGVADAPAPWREAVTALLRSTAAPGHPWSCRGGRVALRLGPAGGTIVVTPAGEAPIARTLAAPEEVLPIGQALLCAPAPAAPAAAPVAATQAPAAPAAAPEAAPPAGAPVVASLGPVDATLPPTGPAPERLLLAASGGTRLLMPRSGLTLGCDVSAAVPISAWLPSVRLRWQHRGLRAENLEDVSAALTLARRWSGSHLELRAGLSLAAAVLVHDLPRPAGQDVRFDARVGATLGVAVPLTSRLRLLAGVDGDLAPLRMPPGSSRNTTTTSGSAARFPAVSYGATIGLEVAR